MPRLVTFGESYLRLAPPDAHRLETTDQLTVRTGGAESNVAVAASRLGTDATWISKLPDTLLGRRVVNDLRRYGIDVDVTWVNNGRVGISFLENAGRPRGTNVIDDRSDIALASAEPAELPVERIRDADAFFVSGVTPAISQTLIETTGRLLATARQADTTTAFDMNYDPNRWDPATAKATYDRLFKMVDVLFADRREAQTVFDTDGTPAEIANHLQSVYDCETVVVTRSKFGALALNEGVMNEFGVYETDTVDPIGSGDAYVGGFLAKHLESGDVKEALRYGAATAALSRTIANDAAIVGKTEVDAVVERGDD